jgi:hypothetical protein
MKTTSFEAALAAASCAPMASSAALCSSAKATGLCCLYTPPTITLHLPPSWTQTLWIAGNMKSGRACAVAAIGVQMSWMTLRLATVNKSEGWERYDMYPSTMNKVRGGERVGIFGKFFVKGWGGTYFSARRNGVK